MIDFAEHDSAHALDAFVAEVLDSAGILTPPVDAFHLADELCISVASDTRQSGRARLARLSAATRSAPQSCILLNDDPRPERRQWAVAHEIGEHLAPELFHRLGLDAAETPRMREEAANAFAGRLLVPAEWFATHGRETDWDLPALKRTFATASHELLARRMLDMPEPVIVTVYDQGRVTWRRSNVTNRRPPLSDEEAACQRRAHESGESIERRLPELTIRAWPVHEPDWKREILRTELHDVY